MINNNGLVKDIHPDDAPALAFNDARNVLLSKKYGSVANEEGAEAFGCDDNVGFIHGIIETDEGYIEFVTLHTGAGISRINRVLSDGTCTCIINDDALGFTIGNPIKGTYHRNYADQLVIIFWEGTGNTANVPRLLNLDCMPFELNEDCEFVNAEDVVLLNLFSPVNLLTIDLTEVLDTGGLLQTGVYYISVSYEHADTSRTSFFNTSNQISIHNDNRKEAFTQIDGAEAGSNSNKSIKVTFSNIDIRFSKLAIAVTSKIGGVVSVVHAASIKIIGSSLTWIYTGNELKADLDIASITVPKTVYDRVQAGDIHGSRLYLGNLRIASAPYIQSYVNNVTLKWSAVTTKEISSYLGSFKNPNNVFYFRDFRSFAVYCFYVIIHMDNGQKWAYFIPGREASTVTVSGAGTVDETDTIGEIIAAGATDTNVIEANNNYSTAKYFQIFDTSKDDGTLGYWENKDELYEDNSCNTILNCAGEEIGTLVGENVRYHRMPNIDRINSAHTDIYDTPNSDTLFFDMDIASSSFDNEGGLTKNGDVNWVLDNDNTSGWGNFNVIDDGPEEFIFSREALINIRLHMEATNVDAFIQFSLLLVRADSISIEYLVKDTYDAGVFGGNKTFRTDFIDISINMGIGDKLIWDFRYTNGSPLEGQPNLTSNSYLEVYLNDPEMLEMTTRLIAIRVEDFCLPESLRAGIVGYELGYAERTPSNQVVFDQDVLKVDADGFFRSHPFDSLYNKTSSAVDFVKAYYKFTADQPFIFLTRTAFTELREVTDSKYISTDVTIPIDNDLREEILFGRLINQFTGVSAATEPPLIYYADAYILADFLRVVDNVYLNRFSQPIVRTGFVYDYSTFATGGFDIFGGDNFRNLYGVFITPSYDNETDEDHELGRIKNLKSLMYPVESIANIGLRHSETHNYYYPFNTDFDNDISIDPDVEAIVNQTTNGLKYNSDYSSVNNLEPQFVVQCRDGCDILDIVRFPYRVHRSVENSSEDYDPGFRTFLANSYYEMPKKKKEIWVIRTMDKILLIQHIQALYYADGSDIMLGNSTEVSVGRGDIFNSDPNEVIPDDRGYIGCKSYWSAFVCPMGYVVVDAITEDRGKVFIYNGKLQEISTKGIRHFLRENLYVNGLDNPFNGAGISATYDEKYNRLLIGKHLVVVENGENRLTGFQAITLSYSFDYECWVCFHDFTPNILFYIRSGFFSVFNINGNGQVFKHNIEGLYGFYYHTSEDGAPLSMYVDFIMPFNSPYSELLQSVQYRTKLLNSSEKELYDKTVTQLMAYNSHQCTDIRTISVYTKLTYKANIVRHNFHTWSWDDIRDYVSDKDSLFINEDGTLVSANLSSTKPYYKQAHLIGTFVIIRFQYNNVDQYKFLITYVDLIKQKALI